MGYLKSGLSRSVAVLSACGVITASAVGFAALDKTVIKPCDVLPPDSSEVQQEEIPTVSVEKMGDVTTVSTVTAVKETAKNAKTEASKAAKTEKTSSTKKTEQTSADESKAAAMTTAVPVSEIPVSVTASQSVSQVVTSAPEQPAGEVSVSDITKQTVAETQPAPQSSETSEAVVTEETTSETSAATTTVKPETTEETTTTTSPAITTTTTAITTTTKAKPNTTATTTAKAPETTAKKTTTVTKATTTSKTTTTAKSTTTAKTTTTTAPKPVDNGTTPESRLNSAVLAPNACLTGNEDKIIRKYLDKIVTDDMTGYQKALACYDYLIKNTYYAYGGWSKPVQAVLEEGYGTCTEYSYVYAAMLNYLGFSARTVDGKTAMAAGGYGYHMWVEVTINGQVYVMDPQVDDNMSWGGLISHARFCKTYDEVAGKYIKN